MASRLTFRARLARLSQSLTFNQLTARRRPQPPFCLTYGDPQSCWPLALILPPVGSFHLVAAGQLLPQDRPSHTTLTTRPACSPNTTLAAWCVCGALLRSSCTPTRNQQGLTVRSVRKKTPCLIFDGTFPLYPTVLTLRIFGIPSSIRTWQTPNIKHLVCTEHFVIHYGTTLPDMG